MGSVMPTIETNTRKVIARLKADGWIEVDGGKLDKFEHPGRSETMVVPRHKALSPDVARSIAKLAGWI
jgi:predicted RNA binding protein YcfA (HicA-like mRNA interferase family)